jgi:hypothetical protein
MSKETLCVRLVVVWCLLVVCVFFPVGCKTKPVVGGKSHSSLGGVGKHTESSLAQPSNPDESSTNESKRKETVEEPTHIVSSRVTETTDDKGIVTTVREEFTPVMRKNIVETSTATKVGGAYKDNSTEIMAKISAMRPVQYAGIGLMVAAAGIMFYAPLRILVGAGKQFPVALGVIGLGLVVSPQLIAGHETLIIVLAAIGVLIYWLSIRLTRKEAEADSAKA